MMKNLADQLAGGKKVLVMGLAKSGEAVTRLLLNQGVQVVVNERSSRETVKEIADDLEALGARGVYGGHPLSILDEQFDFIVKNPGIPYSVPLLVEARARQIPIYTEIEVACWLTTSPIYAITGSNGKTTTTTLVGEILAQAGKSPVVAGNIGRVLSGVIAQIEPYQPIVLEVSSFQLLGTEYFHPHIAAFLNFYPAHLDYHETLEAYADAKWRMFRNMTSSDVAVLNYDQTHIRDRAGEIAAQIVWVSRNHVLSEEGVYLENGQLMFVRAGVRTTILPISMLALKGNHNVENVLVASAVALWAGADVEAIRHVLTTFRGVEHRLEYVATVQGVDFYNDSKATNSQAALASLRSFSDRIVWIAGGLDRGEDFLNLQEELQKRVKAVVLLGQSAERLERACLGAGILDVHRVASLDEAVLVAAKIAEAGDVVLLSPACASWDMFASFEQRGGMFKEAVHRL